MPAAEVPRWTKKKRSAVPSSASRQYVTANKRVAAIGGANAHSRPDRLSFVTSFTVSNDTHCFWTPSSYANRAPGTDSLYYSPFLPRPPYFPPPFALFFRPILFSCFYLGNARATYLFVFPSRSAFSALVRGIATVKFDLLGLRTTWRWKNPARFTRALIESRQIKKNWAFESSTVLKEYTFRGITFSNFLLDNAVHYLFSSFNSCRNCRDASSQSVLLRNAMK